MKFTDRHIVLKLQWVTLQLAGSLKALVKADR
jgi:hypothetical protein